MFGHTLIYIRIYGFNENLLKPEIDGIKVMRTYWNPNDLQKWNSSWVRARHFSCHFTCSRSFWMAPHRFGNAFLTLFHAFTLMWAGSEQLRKRIFNAISRVHAHFGWLRIASETHFWRYFTRSRSCWVALNSFGDAFLTLFHAFTLMLGGSEQLRKRILNAIVYVWTYFDLYSNLWF